MRGSKCFMTARKSMTNDFTSGSPIKHVIRFAFPLFLGMILQQLYGVIDAIIVGQKVGVEALAGVGSTGAISFMVIGFCTGLSGGFAIPVAQQFGAGDEKGLRRYVANSLWLCIFFSVVITVLVCFFCDGILRIMHTPSDIYSYAKTYIFIIFLGIPFTIFYNTLAGVLRAIGDSKTPVICLMVSTVLNIVLDFVFIIGLHMSVEGPAIATIISQALSGVLCLVQMRRGYEVLKFQPGEGRFSWKHVSKLSRLGIPMGLQTSVTGIGIMTLQGAINNLGVKVVAGVTTGLQMNNFLQASLDSVAQTMAPYAGQNLGAGKPERIKQGVKAAIKCGIVIAIVTFVVALLLGRNVAALFMDTPDSEVIEYAYRIVVSMVGTYIFLILLNALRFALQGMGYTTIAVISGFMEVIARVIAALVLIPQFGFLGVQFAHPLAWLFGDLLLIPAFVYCMKDVGKRWKTTPPASEEV